METCPYHQWVLPDGTVWTAFYRHGPDYLLRFPGLADFVVRADGRDVTCLPSPDATKSTVEHLYLNQVLPLALSRQGRLIFHASAVDTKHGAVTFMGKSGKGKSTLAASFATSGYRFLSDDGLIIEDGCEGEYMVLPSHPSIRLWEDSERALLGNGAVSPPVQYTSKARVLADDVILFCDEPQPLHRMYFLGEGLASEATFARMSASEALIELVKHSFVLDVDARDAIASNFDRMSRMGRLPIYYRLDYPRRFDTLSDLRQAILKHCNCPPAGTVNGLQPE